MRTNTTNAPQPKLVTKSVIRSKSVAIVGRSKSLEGSGEGAEIDARDLVLRVNTVLPLKGKPKDIGSRTDIVFSCNSCGIRKYARAAAEKHQALFWSVNNNVRERIGKYVNDPRFVPFSGTMAIFQCLAFGASEVYVSGIDLYTSGPNSVDSRKSQGTAGKLKMKKGFHSPILEQRLLTSLLEDDPRFVPWEPLRRIIQAEAPPTFFREKRNAS